MTKWWSKQKVGTQVAIIGCLGTLVTAVCGSMALIAANFPALSAFKDAEQIKLQQPELRDIGVSEPRLTTAKHNGKSYYIVSSNCWIVTDKNEDITINGEDYAVAQLNFIVLSGGEKILINDVSIILDKHVPAPKNNNLTDYTIKLGQYFEPDIHYTDLGQVDLFPDNNEFHPASMKSVEVPAMEATGFEMLVTFREPGEYTFHIKVLVSNFRQREQELTSEPLTINWVSYQDLSNITFFDPLNAREIKLGECQ